MIDRTRTASRRGFTSIKTDFFDQAWVHYFAPKINESRNSGLEWENRAQNKQVETIPAAIP